MQMINLPGTDLRVSRLCFGTMTYGGQCDEAVARRLTGRALDLGINFFDTANIYNKGASETLLGKTLAGRRSQVILASKVRAKMSDDPLDNGLSRPAIFKAAEDTLRRLNTDYLDVYYLHWPDCDVPVEESLGAMNDLVRQGKVRYIGNSNYSSWQAVEQLWLAERNGWPAPRIAQNMYNLLARALEPEFLPMAKHFGIASIVYNPLAGGLLTGKQKREAPLAGTRFDNNQVYLDRYWHPAYFDAIDDLARISDRAGRSMVSLALNWLLHHTQTDCIVLGASRLEHLEANLAAASEGPLTEEVLNACDNVWGQLRGVTPKYNR